MDRLCDAYEQELLAGQRPDMEAYLAEAESESERARLLAELQAVYEEHDRWLWLPPLPMRSTTLTEWAWCIAM